MAMCRGNRKALWAAIGLVTLVTLRRYRNAFPRRDITPDPPVGNLKAQQILDRVERGEFDSAIRLDMSDCGLTSFPRQLLRLSRLEHLNLGNNHISSLPADLGRMRNLRILWFLGNKFTSIPSVLGSLPSLRMLSFKANNLVEIPEDALSPSLQWLILTDNSLRSLPRSIGKLTGLRKLLLAGNRLTSLPDELAQCAELELVRLGANRFAAFPTWLWTHPTLAWVGLGGNSWCGQPEQSDLDTVPRVEWSAVELGKLLGAGASGAVYEANYQGSLVAVKDFKGAMTSDGSPQDELNATLSAGGRGQGSLLRVLATISESTAHPTRGLVLELLETAFQVIAGPPSLTSITRDTYASERRYSLQWVLGVLSSVANASTFIHSIGLAHGDLYGHNILADTSGRAYLTDFGAAYFYKRGGVALADVERLEVRAFGLLIFELVGGLDVQEADTRVGLVALLLQLHTRCVDTDVWRRPPFVEIGKVLCDLAS